MPIPGINPRTSNATTFGTRTLTFLDRDHDHDGSFGGSDTWTFNGLTLDAAAAGRWIVVGIATHGGSSPISLTSCTVNGTAIRNVIEDEFNDGTNVTAALGLVYLPGGTTADVVVNLNDGVSDCDVALWSLTGITSYHPVDTATDEDSAINVTMDTVDDGVVIAIISSQNLLAPSATWTNITEVFDASNNGINFTAATASTSAGTLNFSCALTGTSDCNVMVAMTL